MSSNHLLIFKELFLQSYTDMVRTALFYVHDTGIAEDIVEDIFVKLWEKRHCLTAISNTRSYLQNAVRNSCLNYLEHLHVEDKYQQKFLNETEDEQISSEDYIIRVRELLQELPPKRRRILELSAIESRTYQEIASEMDISINTVKDHIKKAYAFIRGKLDREIPAAILWFILKKKIFC